MIYTIKSRKLNRKLTFSRPGKSYIFIDTNNKPGTLGEQICSKGNTNYGNTLAYHGDNEQEFTDICKKWYRKFMNNLKGVTNNEF